MVPIQQGLIRLLVLQLDSPGCSSPSLRYPLWKVSTTLQPQFKRATSTIKGNIVHLNSMYSAWMQLKFSWRWDYNIFLTGSSARNFQRALTTHLGIPKLCGILVSPDSNCLTSHILCSPWCPKHMVADQMTWIQSQPSLYNIGFPRVTSSYGNPYVWHDINDGLTD